MLCGSLRPPPPSQHPLAGALAGGAPHGRSGPHRPPRLIKRSGSQWRRAPRSGRPGAGGDPRAERGGCSSPVSRALARVRVAAGESRCGRGGARAASAGSPQGAGRPARDPQPKKPRGRSGAAVREGGQVWLRRALGFASCVWGGGGGLSPPELGSDPGPPSRRRPPGVPSSPPLLDPVRPGRTGAWERAAPCWRATSASRGCPRRKTLQPVSIQGRRGGPGTPSAAAVASGMPMDGGFPGTGGRRRSRRRGPQSPVAGTVPRAAPQ
ncbi:hypothetical protein HPG69_004303 [Diceros bicornis minor]|uniref:Uncharacterized protein n=1 Tax=Diceros bicornis minor TaxID=77932 RepID=A0A7J7F6R4_DICBM|nr:hypothetical protein HPG69_004303 [Diceros bicornis minor]